MKANIITLATLGLLLASLHAQTTVPAHISYQGRVADSSGAGLGTGTPVNRKVVFRLFDAAVAGNRLWTEEQTVTFSNGDFSVLLGNGTTATGTAAGESRPALDTVFTTGTTERYMQITVDNGDNTITAADQPISPRQRMTSTAYTFRARAAESIVTGQDLLMNDSANHGLGWHGSGRLFNGAAINGPVLFGQGGGALGTKSGATQTTAMTWTTSGVSFPQSVTFSSGMSGNGAGLTSLNASQLTSGTVSASLIPGLDAGKITSGTFDVNRIPTLDQGRIPTLDINSKTTGTLADARLSPNVVLQNSSPTFINSSVANLEVRSVGSTPYIDFSRDGSDYNARIILSGDHLGVHGNTTFYNHVGIGTTNPQTRLQVQDGSVWVSGNGAGALPQASGTGLRLYYDASSDFASMFAYNYSNGTPRNLVLQAAGGNVGVGATSPVTKLHVEGSGDTEISLVSTDNNRRWTMQASGGGAPTFQIIDRSAVASRLTIDTTGRVGIGTSTPTAMLTVTGQSAANMSGAHRYFDSGTGSGLSSSGNFNASHPASISASGAVFAGLFAAFSDSRIKLIHQKSSGADDLSKLLGIEITDYLYKDTITKGCGPQKKVIAQQVEKVFPQAVSITKDVVPDIFEKAEFKDGWVMLKTDLKKGDRVRLMDAKREEVFEVLEIDEEDHSKFRTDFKPAEGNVFVYGREVNDFRVVDYDAISMLNVSATQQIKKEKDAEVQALQAETAALRARIAAQQEEIATLRAADKARDAKLAAIEKLLLSADKPAALPVSLKRGDGAE